MCERRFIYPRSIITLLIHTATCVINAACVKSDSPVLWNEEVKGTIIKNIIYPTGAQGILG